MAKRKSAKPPKSIDAWLQRQPEKQQATLQRKLKELDQVYKGMQSDDFPLLHRVGSRVAAFFPEGGRHYGDNVIELLAAHLQPDPDDTSKSLRNYLYHARNFALKYNYKQARELAKARNQEEAPLTALHVQALVSMKDDKQRAELQVKCLKENWSGLRLRREVQNKSGRKRSHGGRKPQRPERQSPGVALRDIAVMSGRWTRSHQAWFARSDAALRKLKKRDRNQAVLAEMEAAIEGLEQVGKAAKDGLKRLKTIHRELENT
jgi:hypothetical protein